MQKRNNWLETFFEFETIGFVVVDQQGNVAFTTNQILSSLDQEGSEQLKFEDIFSDKTFKDFLADINYDKVKEEKIELELTLKNKSVGKYMAISGNKQNEDGTFNIFIIQK